jgi:hypothetical protein
MKSNATLVYNFFLVIGDFLALVAAFAGAFLIRAQSATPVAHPISGHTYVYVFLGVLPFWLLIFALLGLYNTNIYERRFSEAGRLLVSLHPIIPSKLVPIYGLGLAFIFLILFRNIARLIRTELFGFKIGLTKVLVVGNTSVTDELVDSLVDSRHSGYQLIGVVNAKEHTYAKNVPVYHSFQEYLEGAGTSTLHGIIQTELYKDEAKNREVLEYAQVHHIGYRFIPGNTELFVGNIDVELFRNSMPVIAVRQTPLFGWGRVVKRLFDFFMGSIFLVIAIPFMVLIAIAIKISDPKGPVFMRGKAQNRLTRFDQVFKVYKFRTHYAKFDGKTDEEVFEMVGKPELIKVYRANGDKLDNDFRVTPVGKFLRATYRMKSAASWTFTTYRTGASGWI